VALLLRITNRAASRKGKTSGTAGELFHKASKLLAARYKIAPKPDRAAARNLHERLRDFQNEYVRQRWGPVRVVHHWNLMPVKKGLALYLWHRDSPAHRYDLAVNCCQHYDPRHGNGLSGPSRTKLLEMVRFMFLVEAQEDEPS